MSDQQIAARAGASAEIRPPEPGSPSELQHPLAQGGSRTTPVERLREGFEAVVAEFDALAEDALQLCDQHISPEVRKETQFRVVGRVQGFDEVRKIAALPSSLAGPEGRAADA